MTTAPTGAPAPATQPKITPSIAWVIFAVLLMLIGPAGCLVGVVNKGLDLLDQFDEFGRYGLPVSGVPIRFDARVTDGAVYLDESEPSAAIGRFDLVDAEGHRIELVPVGARTTFNFDDGRTKAELVQVGRFDVTHPGLYRLTATPSGESGRGSTIWIGREVSSSDAGRFVVFLLVGGLVGLVGLVMLIVVLVRRGSAKRASQPPPPWGGYPGYPAYPAPGYGGPPGYGQPPYAPPGYGTPPGYAPPPGYPPPPGAPPGYGQPPAPGPAWAPPPEGWAPPPTAPPGWGPPPAAPSDAPPPPPDAPPPPPPDAPPPPPPPPPD